MLSKRINAWILSVMAVAGVLFVVLVQDHRLAAFVFLTVTCVESGLFTILYGLRSQWRRSGPSRALFWIVFAYFLLSAHIMLSFVWRSDYAIRDDIRQVLYLFLALTGMNIMLTVFRIQQEDRNRRRSESALDVLVAGSEKETQG